jgi:hypothetical protein
MTLLLISSTYSSYLDITLAYQYEIEPQRSYGMIVWGIIGILIVINVAWLIKSLITKDWNFVPAKPKTTYMRTIVGVPYIILVFLIFFF